MSRKLAVDEDPMSHSTQSGATLIEILITVLVLGLGLLGVGALQTRSIQANHDATMYSRAAFLAGDIAERMRANPAGVRAGSYARTLNTTVLAGSDCATGPCSPTQLASYDIDQWLRQRVKVELPEGDAAISSPNWNSTTAGGTVARIDVTLTIRWKARVGGNCAANGTAGTDYRCFTTNLGL